MTTPHDTANERGHAQAAQGARDELNEPQAAAAAHGEGGLCWSSQEPGAARRGLITYRIANLVALANVPPWRILAVTFTNKAAGEMRTRLAKLCGPELARALWVGTFHATCAKLLRAHGTPLGVKSSFVIYDAADQKAVVTRALKEHDLDERRYPPRAVLSHIHKHKQEGRGPDEAASHSYVDDVALRIFRTYEERLRAANAGRLRGSSSCSSPGLSSVYGRRSRRRRTQSLRKGTDPALLRLRPRRRVPGHERRSSASCGSSCATSSGTSASWATTTRAI